MATTTLTLPPTLTDELDVLMIDNFDSFTWNLYQQLRLAGAEVTVIRNDAIDPSLFSQLKIKSLIISPGPGHPQNESGISKAAIQYFEGKVPILGVCMGLECLVDFHGGQIGYAGEIMHGKVSRIKHDNRGCFKGIPQGIKSIRYHSLSASLTTLPSELAITALTEESNVIMGVRHRKYTVEAVQYHPESILSEGGDELIRNFLALRGGLWEDNPDFQVSRDAPPFHVEPGAPHVMNPKVHSILDKIHTQRLADVAQAQKAPGTTLTDLQTLYSLNIAPPQIPLLPRLKQTQGRLSLLAEIKRASPSKGPISVATSPASQALTYALAGANVISVLTEPKWFLGSLQDMLHARTAVASLPNRPAILRKDFILSRYQVLESRIWGADTILLIVSMLSEGLLRDLYQYSLELGMEPLVEVNNAKEMELALSLPAKVIGVNNRNLHDFAVDMSTTSRLSEMTKGKDVILCALSGIATPEDVEKYGAEGVNAVLIGESLMRARDPAAFIHQLFSLPSPTPPSCHWSSGPPLVKICGVRSKEQALAIAEAGADMIGLVFVQKSKRYVDLDTAREISLAIRGSRPPPSPSSLDDESLNAPWFTSQATRLSSTISQPSIVGVFQDAPLSVILYAVSYCQLDIVQLHGAEPMEMANQIPVPVIRVCHVSSKGADISGVIRPGLHEFVLLDSIREDGSGITGGSGKVVDLALARRIVDAGELVQDEAGATNSSEDVKTPISGTDSEGRSHAKVAATPAAIPSKYPLPIILAGGLKPENVAEAITHVQPWAVDVSGGVETEDGKAKDLDKVRAFINSTKQLV
ncbi:hypothetical protein E1B28_010068 [Marasmius oreades]|uniref:Multifunctional tryptophan biosynthesis protein n=1 Tax=Marasmius oreades TaxID=181124 RepID=A0A9P7RWH2_9AGAR|nr:uncharacterized protein E1B28_010068 [Marasmius oreades]KAG7091002.1 hypothetical protein E1B28_010068 [Marasmius oreades]